MDDGKRELEAGELAKRSKKKKSKVPIINGNDRKY